jgi:hypothetical protein
MTATEQLLADVANVAQILTAAAAAFFSIRLGIYAYGRRLRLETYLKEVREREKLRGNLGAMTDIRLSADLGMTTSQVHDAAFLSRKIKTWAIFDPETRRASGIMFQYRD